MRMFRRLTLLGLLAGWMGFLLWQGCGESLPTVLKICNSNKDCASNQRCIQNVCAGTGQASTSEPPTSENNFGLEKTVQESPAQESSKGEQSTDRLADGGVEVTPDTTIQPEETDPDTDETTPPENSTDRVLTDQDPCLKGIKRKEECNGIDDDCDGQIDNISGTQEPLTQECYDGLPTTLYPNSPCQKGTATCEKGVWADCKGQKLPKKEETCNGVDDDCNGSIDDNVQDAGKSCKVQGKFGECEEGKEFCKSGKLVCQQVNTLRTEICDNKDNDCDGQVDNLQRECYTGAPGTANVGACKKGIQRCDKGKWEKTCTGEVKEEKEVCDGKTDENCNGRIDENCQCTENDSRWCGTQQGSCKLGKQTCTQGKWGNCVGGVGPTAEVCDGKDNDCDGQVDEGNPEGGKACSVSTNKGLCVQGEERCQSGSLACVSIYQPLPESCDGKDNNCNGTVDEGVLKTFYRDKDGDKFGDSNDTKQGCTAPAGYVEKPGDCDDGNKDVFPGQTRYFSNRRSNRTYDYNCNGKNDKEYPTKGSCSGDCKKVSTKGFVGWFVPDCGWQGYLLKSCSRGILGCREDGDWVTQKCR
ncbi:MAG: hypothetical protein EP343_15185 [Deltaproteobacteria bacterium]|nr:MAG: hypothetical protein EP343_15185 [Deltaproteobacteria bacterium]